MVLCPSGSCECGFVRGGTLVLVGIRLFLRRKGSLPARRYCRNAGYVASASSPSAHYCAAAGRAGCILDPSWSKSDACACIQQYACVRVGPKAGQNLHRSIVRLRASAAVCVCVCLTHSRILQSRRARQKRRAGVSRPCGRVCCTSVDAPLAPLCGFYRCACVCVCVVCSQR